MVTDETQLGLTGVRRLKKLGAAEQGKVTGKWAGCHYQEKGMQTCYDEKLLIGSKMLAEMRTWLSFIRHFWANARRLIYSEK